MATMANGRAGPDIDQCDLSLRYVLIQIWSFCAGRKPSCGGLFAYVCIEKLAFVDNSIQRKISIKYRIGACA